MIKYLPLEERVPDTQYTELLKKILRSGKKVMPQQGEYALHVLGHEMRFDLSNGAPIIPHRDMVAGNHSNVDQAIGEYCAFINGARTLDQLKEFGNLWWKRWATPEKCLKRGLESGDLGPGSYGAAFHDFPTQDGGTFNQFRHLVEQIKELPHLRTHLVTPFIPQYLGRGRGKTQKVCVVPCHGMIFVSVDTESREISMNHIQRSGDVPVGVAGNLVQYSALLLMLAQVTGYRAKELVYYISDAHIYERQIPDVERLVATEPQKFPKLILDPNVENIFAFRREHFHVEEYEPRLERMNIWTPV